jgi:hypothetical protein
VQAAKGMLLPEDGSWIEEGIQKKVKLYDATMHRTLTLLIDIASVVDHPQIEAFKNADFGEELPFAATWIVGLQGMICLKRPTNQSSKA